jgi:protein-S-isoprenylcysteine O-methyltransferase Ste14
MHNFCCSVDSRPDRLLGVSMQGPPDSSGVIVFPPLLMGLALLIVGVLHWLWPLPVSVSMRPVTFVFGIVIGIMGAGLMAWGHRTLVKGGTNVSPLKPTTVIITTGPFRFTRNPLYVGAMILLLAFSLAIGTLWGLTVIVPVFFILHYGIILREERYLERKFGKSYIK